MSQLDYGKGSITKNIIASAIPMLIAQLVNLLYTLVDRVFIGRIPVVGAEALGGLGLTFPVVILIMAFTNLYSGGGAPLFAIARGEKNPRKASQILTLCFFLEVGTAILITGLGQLLAEPMMRVFGADDEALLFALPYLRIYLCGTLFCMVAIGMNPFINAQGMPAFGMFSVVIGAILNLVLDPIFIFPMGMGIRGAAVATVISQAVSAIVVLCILRRRRMPIRLIFRVHGRSLRQIWSILTLGLAAFVMQFTNALVSLVCNAVLARTGGNLYVSVMTVITSLRQIFETPILAICEGSSPAISYNYGAEAYDRVRRSIRVMSYLSLGYTAVIWALLMLFPTAFVGIISDDPDILHQTVGATRIYFCAFLFMTLQYIGQTSYKALNQRARSIFFSIFRKVILVVPLTYLLPLILEPSVNGVFAAEPVSNILGGSASFFTMVVFVRKLHKEKNTGSYRA
ncbi:MAG: MATE family efflux transporter [Eubacterium sp.]|nr:MATE family efflux transporter [Eubacterium sp.]